MRRVSLLLMILGITWTSRVFGEPPRDQSVDEAAIRKMVDRTSKRLIATTPNRSQITGRPMRSI
jgi:hypothetical protein